MEEFLALLRLLWRLVRLALDALSYAACALLLCVSFVLPWRAVTVRESRKEKVPFRLMCLFCFAFTLVDLVCVPLGLAGALVPTRTYAYFADFREILKDDQVELGFNVNLRLMWFCLFFLALWDLFCLAVCAPSLVVPTRLCAVVRGTIANAGALRWAPSGESEYVSLHGLWLASPLEGAAEVAALVLGAVGLLSGVRTCQTLQDARAALAEGREDAVFKNHGFNCRLVRALCVNGVSVVVDAVFMPLLLALALGCWRLPPVATELRRGVDWRARGLIALQFARLLLDLLLAAPLALVLVSWRRAPPKVVRAVRGLCRSRAADRPTAAADLEAGAPPGRTRQFAVAVDGEFTVAVDKTAGQKLGITWKPVRSDDGGFLEIDVVLSDGLVQQWNDDHPTLAVEPGDRIVEVNGIRNDVDQLRNEVQKFKKLELRVKCNKAEDGDDWSPVTECHMDIMRSFALVVLDLLAAPLVAVLAVLSFYRVPALFGGFRGHSFLMEGLSFHREVLVQILGLAADLPFLLAGLVLLLSGWRADLALRACARQSQLTYGERRKLVGKQFLFLLRDLAMLVPLALVVVTLYRLPPLMLALKARMSRLLTGDPEMQPLEVRVSVPDPKGKLSLVIRASKEPDLSGVASLQLQITGDDFWKAIAQWKGATVAAAAQALLPLALRDGKEVDFGCVQRGRDEAELAIELQRPVGREKVLKMLQKLPPSAEMLIQLEARLDSQREAVLLAVPLTVAQLAEGLASESGRVQLAAQPGLGEGRLEELRGSTARMLRRDVWWMPVLTGVTGVATDLAHLALLVGLLACPWRFTMALVQIFETQGQRTGRLAGAVLVALDYWEAECRRLMSRVEPLANVYAKAAVRAGSGLDEDASEGDAPRAKGPPDGDTGICCEVASCCGDLCCELAGCCLCRCCWKRCPCCPKRDVDSGPDSDGDDRVPARQRAAKALDGRLKRLVRRLAPARALLRHTRKRWPEEPEWASLSDAVDARLEAWSQAFFWTLLLPEVHLLLTSQKITQAQHARLCQVVRNRAAPRARELHSALQLQQQNACEQHLSRKKGLSTCYSVIREHVVKGITDFLSLPLILLLIVTMYRLPNLSIGVARPFDMERLKTAVRIEASALGGDVLVVLQFLGLATLLTVTVVKLPDFLWGIRPARGLREARDWALEKVSELAVGLAELIMMIFAWKACRLVITAVIFVTLTPAAMLAALLLPDRLASSARLVLASAVWLGTAALAFVVGDLAGLVAAAVLLAVAFLGLAVREALGEPQGWAARKDGDWWSPQARWTTPNLFAMVGILTEGAVLCWAGAALAGLTPGPAELPNVGVGPAAGGVGVVAAALLHITLPMVVEEDEQAGIVDDAAWRAARQLFQEVLFLPTVAVVAPMTPSHPAWTLPLLYFAAVTTLSSAAWGTTVSRAGLLDIRTLGLSSSGRQLLLAAAVVGAARGWRTPFVSLALAASLWSLAWTPRGAAVRWAELLRAGASVAGAGAALDGLPRGSLAAAAACWVGLAVAFAVAAGWWRRRRLAATMVPRLLEALGLLQARLSLWGDGQQHAALGASVPQAAAALLDLEERMPFDRLRPNFLRARRGWRARLLRAADYDEVLSDLKKLEGALVEPPTRILLRQVLERVPLADGGGMPKQLAARIVELAEPRPSATPPDPPRGWQHGKLDLKAARRAAAREAAELPAQMQTSAAKATSQKTATAPAPAVMSVGARRRHIVMSTGYLEARQKSPQAYLVDNSAFNSANEGLSYRNSTNMQDKDGDEVAPWGSIVHGVDQKDGWVRVGDRFLPMQFQGITLLKLLESQKECVKVGDYVRMTTDALELRRELANTPYVWDDAMSDILGTTLEVMEVREDGRIIGLLQAIAGGGYHVWFYPASCVSLQEGNDLRPDDSNAVEEGNEVISL